ncbi:MAG: penicillin acylase family protein [Sediminibacterium sp.]|nr:penicillin acylase family protein [Sediminibacterium sp.]
MKNYCFLFVLLVTSISLSAQKPSSAELSRWNQHAQQTTIIRDEWDIPHVYGKTDADAVFGLMYAQCEENFPQIEKNFLEMLGRRAEMEGPTMIYEDLMMQLIQDSAAAVKDFERSPLWFKQLLIAHADGINYYLSKHPEVKPVVLKKFKPWYHLMWTDGSVSPTRSAGITEKHVEAFYGQQLFASPNAVSANYNKASSASAFEEPNYDMEDKTLKGSNGFAIAPKHSASGNAMLYINPHVPFYFRSEMHMVSEQGLNAYGAVTWGQFFIYQGFNENCGWMHTSSYADVADVYEEQVQKINNELFYTYEKENKKIGARKIDIKYVENGVLKNKSFDTYFTGHGPVMGMQKGKWLSLQENNRSLDALMECWTRTKSKSLADYTKAMELLANNSNNTVYADNAGNIAYWHGNFMPKRNPSFDYTMPVDGTTKATDWNGLHHLNEIVQSINPANGWLQNCNATPFTVAGSNSPKANNYPAYMAPDGENGRGITAVALLSKIDKINLDELIALGYNRKLSAFDMLLPGFIQKATTTTLAPRTKKAIAYLANWDHYADTNSIATSIAIEWATKWGAEIPPANTEEAATQILVKYNRMDQEVAFETKIQLLEATLDQFEKWYGGWEITWGAINRYQRVAPGANFDDNQASLAVNQASSRWGGLPSFESKRYPNTIKKYGYTGNSFVAAVEFGKRLKAKTIITGGQSRFAESKHFTDQAYGYLHGQFKTIHYYKEDVLANKKLAYHPGLAK